CPICAKVLTRADKSGLLAHAAFHCLEGKVWFCRGVPKEDAARFGIPPDARSYTFLGRERVGGCLKAFYDRDRLDRHLSGTYTTC
ncbi:hypothetical protein B0H11DRAFT_1646759, partial [Mycena galericulata]